jgi:pectinesterase
MRKSTSFMALSVLVLAAWGCGDGGGGGSGKGGTTGSGGRGGTTGSAGTTGGQGGAAAGSSGGAAAGSNGGALAGSSGGSTAGSSGGAVAGSAGGSVAGSSGGGAAGRGGTGGGATGTAGATGGSTAGTGGGAAGKGGSAAGAGGTAGASGGTAGTGGGATGTAGGGAAGTGAGGAPATCTAMWTGDAKRPQLTDASAACYTIERYLAQTGTIGALTTDNWNPTAGLPAAASLTPMFTVAADGSGTHTTVQAAITAAKAVTGGGRVNVLIKPGTYRELVCVDGTAPITLYGADTDATQVTIVFNNYSGKTVDADHVNACSNPLTATTPKTTYGTSDSTTVFVKAAGFQAMNLTIANDTDEIAAGNPSSIQAVALTTQGDQGVFQNVRLLGNQDTLQVKTSAVTVAARMYFKNSTIEGDTDFIFGRATAVFDGCTLFYVSGRKTNSTHISPSTEMPVGFGFLIINSKIMGATGISGTTLLGRAWDDSSGTMPNGQAIIRETQIAAHINVAAPWGVAATSSRAFDANTNRLYEYKNTGAGAAP